MKQETYYKCNCGIEMTLKKIGGKWKSLILWFLINEGTKRYGEIRKFLPAITNKMLSQQLKELVLDNLISRKDYGEIPPRVDYTITEKGESLKPILTEMCNWGNSINCT